MGQKYTGPERRDESYVKGIAKEAAEMAIKDTVPAAVNETLTRLGINPAEPFEAQRDQQFLRATRKRCEGASNRAGLVLISLVIAGALAAFWAGFKSKLGLG